MGSFDDLHVVKFDVADDYRESWLSLTEEFTAAMNTEDRFALVALRR